jgi:hypothetical protein
MPLPSRFTSGRSTGFTDAISKSANAANAANKAPNNQRLEQPPVSVPMHVFEQILDDSSAESEQAAGVSVNDFSRAVLPKEQFPFHFECLMMDLHRRGISPESWQVISGDEVRLDEDGMDVEFTLLKVGTDHLWRRRINVQRGRLISIIER